MLLSFVPRNTKASPASPYRPRRTCGATGSPKTGRKGKGLFMPLRKAVTGQAHGPDMSDVMPLLQVVKARG